MTKTKDLIQFKTSEKIRLDEARVRFDKEVETHRAKLWGEAEENRHKNQMTELEAYGHILPMFIEALRTQKELLDKGLKLEPMTLDSRKLGKGIIEGLIETEEKFIRKANR